MLTLDKSANGRLQIRGCIEHDIGKLYPDKKACRKYVDKYAEHLSREGKEIAYAHFKWLDMFKH